MKIDNDERNMPCSSFNANRLLQWTTLIEHVLEYCEVNIETPSDVAGDLLSFFFHTAYFNFRVLVKRRALSKPNSGHTTMLL